MNCEKTSVTFALLCAALGLSACQRGSGETARSASSDSCALARPRFSSALPAERSTFAYDSSAPLNVRLEAQSTQNDIERSTISFDSPGGGRARAAEGCERFAIS